MVIDDGLGILCLCALVGLYVVQQSGFFRFPRREIVGFGVGLDALDQTTDHRTGNHVYLNPA